MANNLFGWTAIIGNWREQIVCWRGRECRLEATLRQCGCFEFLTTDLQLMGHIVNYFIKSPIAANLLMVGLFILGIMGFNQMKSTFFPETESRIINIQLVYPGASPEEIEQGVVQRIEENLKGLTGIEQYTSVSRENSGSITVEVLKGYDPDLVLQDVKNAVDRISSFPTDLEPPVVFKQENINFAISFALTGSDDLYTLKRFGRKVEDELRAIEGISQVSLSGFPDEEIEIAFRERDLEAFGLTFAQAALAVRNANLDITGGTIKGENEELLLRARNKSYFAEGLRDIVVKTGSDGSVIRLHQVADLADQWSDNPDRSYLNGEPSVVVSISNTMEEDMLSITESVKNYFEEFNRRNPTIQATLIRDSSTVLSQRIDLLTENGILGFFIVLILLAMFLHWRLAFWVALAIPISFAGMFVVASLLGVSINVISLFGMILVIGILVDDGIVISESIYQEYEKGVPRFQAAFQGTMKVLPAVFTAIVTTIFAFGTFFLLDGRLGDFFVEMAIVVIFSLIFSLVEGAVILPAHVAHSKALDSDGERSGLVRIFENGLMWLRDKIYGRVLRFCMNNKWVTLSFLFSLLLVTMGAFSGGIIRSTFFPIIERNNINVNLKMPAGTREHITMDRLLRIQAAAERVNVELSQKFFNGELDAITKVQLNIGPTTYEGQLDIEILDSELREPMTVRDVSNALRKETGLMPDAEVLSFGSASVFGKPVSISLVGSDIEQLDAAAQEVRQAMSELPELADVVDNNQEGLREITISLTEKGQFLGLDLRQVLGQVRSGFFGSEVQRLQRGQDEVRVWVRYAESDRQDINQLRNMRIRLADGREFPLSEIASLEMERGVTAINHINGKREIKVEADIAGNDVSVSDVTNSLKTSIVPEILSAYPAVSGLYEGQNREQQKTQTSLQTALPLIAFLMFFSIALTFRSISQTVVVFALIPFGLIGAAWGHSIMNMPMSLFSALGLIALVGILVNDALVFVTTYNDNLKDGMDQMEAVYETAISRFRPILLTSVTTVAGLGPLLLEKSVQAKFLIPMAVSVAFGLIVITLIILVLLPVLLILSNRLKVAALGLWNGVTPAYRDVEPAVPGSIRNMPLYLFASVLSLGLGVGLVMLLMRLSTIVL